VFVFVSDCVGCRVCVRVCVCVCAHCLCICVCVCLHGCVCNLPRQQITMETRRAQAWLAADLWQSLAEATPEGVYLELPPPAGEGERERARERQKHTPQHTIQI